MHVILPKRKIYHCNSSTFFLTFYRNFTWWFQCLGHAIKLRHRLHRYRYYACLKSFCLFGGGGVLRTGIFGEHTNPSLYELPICIYTYNEHCKFVPIFLFTNTVFAAAVALHEQMILRNSPPPSICWTNPLTLVLIVKENCINFLSPILYGLYIHVAIKGLIRAIVCSLFT